MQLNIDICPFKVNIYIDITCIVTKNDHKRMLEHNVKPVQSSPITLTSGRDSPILYNSDLSWAWPWWVFSLLLCLSLHDPKL